MQGSKKIKTKGYDPSSSSIDQNNRDSIFCDVKDLVAAFVSISDKGDINDSSICPELEKFW